MDLRRRATLILGGALLLRLLRALCRWDEWALHYSGYHQGTEQALLSLDLRGALTIWSGLHPPLYSILHSLGSIIWPAPISWLVFSALCSAGAVLAVLKIRDASVALLAGLLLATDPVQLHYAAEVNNYPLMVATIGLAWWAHSHDRWAILAVSGVLAAWTHVLGGLAVGLLALTGPHRWRVLGLMAIGSLPLLPTAVTLLSDQGSRAQPPLLLGETFADALDRFKGRFLLCLPALCIGMWRKPHLALVWGGTAAAWAGLVLAGLAAPHQLSYALALGIPAAVLIAGGATNSWIRAAVLLACGLSVVGMAGNDLRRLRDLAQGGDGAVAAAQVIEQSAPGDAIVLVRGLDEQDDDKRHTSAVLWRFHPWEAMPAVPSTDLAPHAAGNPRTWRGRTLYTFDQPRPIIAQLPHRRVFTVAYGAAAQTLDIPTHASQGAWHMRGEAAWRGPIQDPGSGAPD